MPFNFMAAVTNCSDFGAQENKVCHCFHCSPIYLLWSDGTGCHGLHFFFILQLIFILFRVKQVFIFWTLSLSQLFHSPVSLSSRGSLFPLLIFLLAKKKKERKNNHVATSCLGLLLPPDNISPLIPQFDVFSVSIHRFLLSLISEH